MPTVSNIDQNISITCNKDETIFDALDAKGHQLPHGCLSGNCTACIIEIDQDSSYLSPIDLVEENSLQRFLEKFPEQKEKNLRLACRAMAIKDISFRSLKK